MLGLPVDGIFGKLSSPCGDKLQSNEKLGMTRNEIKLSSPCGDKLQ